MTLSGFQKEITTTLLGSEREKKGKKSVLGFQSEKNDVDPTGI